MKKHTGSVYAVLVGVLAVALILALGFIYWQNYVDSNDEAKSDSAATANQEEESATQTVTDTSKTYSIELPSGWERTDEQVSEENPGSAWTTYQRMAESITIETFTEGTYTEYSSGQPPTLVEQLPVTDWYDKQGVEYAATESQAPGSSHGGYAYKLSRYRGQTNNAVVYVLNDDVLYKIMVMEGNDTLFKGVNADGEVMYEFTSDVKQILDSFKII